ncbi:two-component system regulatory protein YycI [Pseudalkalibacillus caeni]|nr:two-component system regulatory protein YycI [Pseudalkalibacillus caeni]
MDWSRVKTIFILTFLLFDVFLAYQLIDKKNTSSQFEQYKKAPIQKTLADANISFKKALPPPETPTVMDFISGDTHVFTKDKINEKEKATNQKITPVPENTKEITKIKSEMKGDPFDIADSLKDANFSIFLETNVINGSEYRFSYVDQEDPKHLVFYQTYQDNQIFKQDRGKLDIYLNDDGDIVSYEQTYLNVKTLKEDQKIESAIQALSLLHTNRYLQANDKVTEIKLGYSTFNTDAGASEVLVFVPTWRVLVNGEKFFYVNAVEGTISQLETEKPNEEVSGKAIDNEKAIPKQLKRNE